MFGFKTAKLDETERPKLISSVKQDQQSFPTIEVKSFQNEPTTPVRDIFELARNITTNAVRRRRFRRSISII